MAGTRSAMFAPVADLGLVVLWDEGDDLHAEPRAPYPHAQGSAGAAGLSRSQRRAHRRLRQDGGSCAAGVEWLGPAPGRGTGRGTEARASRPASRQRGRARQRRGRPVGPTAQHRAADGAGRARCGSGARPGAEAWLPRGRGVRAVPCPCTLQLRRAGRASWPAGATALRLVRLGHRPELPPLRTPGAARGADRRQADGRRARPGVQPAACADIRRQRRAGPGRQRARCRGRDARRGARCRWRVPRGHPAGRLGHAGARQPACSRGGAAAVAERGRAGPVRARTAAASSSSPTAASRRCKP